MAKKVKKNKKIDALKKKDKPDVVVGELPNFKNEDYLKLKANMEAILQKEKEEYERALEEQRKRQEIEEENVRKAKRYIEQEKKKREELSNKEVSIEQPEILNQIDIFTNLNDKRMKTRKYEIEKTNALPDDFRVKKYLQVNKLPNKPRTAKLNSPEEVATMLVSSKKEIFERSGKAKAMKKAKLTKEEKLEMEKIYLERAELEAQMINMFQPKGLKIPMYEIYWIVQNDIIASQKIYKDTKNPFQNISEFQFCDSLVWASRYLLEMVYTADYPLDFLKKDCLEISEDLYSHYKLIKGNVTAWDVEYASIELIKQMIQRFHYSSMVVNI